MDSSPLRWYKLCFSICYKWFIIFIPGFFCGSFYIAEANRDTKVLLTQKLGKMIMIIRIKVQNHHSTFKITSTIVFRWTIISNAPKTYKYHVLLYGNLILTYKRTLNDPLYLEMLSHRAVNEILQTP